MRNTKYILLSLIMLAFIAFLLYEGWFILQRFFEVITLYKWVGAGIVIFAILHYFVRRNREMMGVFSHELTHAVVAVACFREILSLQVNQRDGVVWTRGRTWSEVFVTLAPYCLPLFTYIMLFLWSLVATPQLAISGGLWAFDIIVGMTIMFHIVCFKEQTRPDQTDIQEYPLYFSYLYIWLFRLLNLLVIILCYMPLARTHEPMKLWGAFWYLLQNLWADILKVIL